MITVRQIDKLWASKSFTKLFRELTSARPEASLRAEMELGKPVSVAAMAIIRLDELSQSYVPMYGQMLRYILSQQQADGGWGDAMTTALCIRALLCGKGGGVALEQGLTYLAQLQKSDGGWPMVPIRRMAADGFATAFIMLQLGETSDFRRAVRFSEAVDWLERNLSELDGDAQKLWGRAASRCKRGEEIAGIESHLLS